MMDIRSHTTVFKCGLSETTFLSKFKAHFELSDLRKFAEQYGDILEWEQSNRKYVLTHGVGGVEWRHYKNPQADLVYDVLYEVLGRRELENLTEPAFFDFF